MSNSSMVQKPIIKKDINDPSYTGPGKWTCMNIIASEIFSDEDEINAIKTIKIILDNMNCSCSDHIRAYMLNHNIDNSRGIKDKNGRYIGVAKYIWLFHNNVNIRLNKPLFEWNDFSETFIYKTKITPCSL
jgi:hypothetical protein